MNRITGISHPRNPTKGPDVPSRISNPLVPELQQQVQMDDESLRSELRLRCDRWSYGQSNQLSGWTARIRAKQSIAVFWLWVGFLGSTVLVVGSSAGCRGSEKIPPAVSVRNWRIPGAAIAVAPAVNLSGSANFDPERFADLMASELHYVDQTSVIPVSRVLAVLAAQGHRGVESPEHAMGLLKLLGADAILVFAVTEYDPYDPPSIGITAQLYGARPGSGVRETISQETESSADSRPGAPPVERRTQLVAQTQRVFDAAHESVADDIRRFSAQRNADQSPFGWRRYVVSQQEFVRYCCHATVKSLLAD